MSLMKLGDLKMTSGGLGSSVLIFGMLVVAFPKTGEAQSTLVDEGTFEISLNGVPAGSERFSIRSSGPSSSPQLIATAEITLAEGGADVNLRPALQLTGSDMGIAAYQVKISGGISEEVFVTTTDGRFLTRSLSDRGEREGELRAEPGTVLLDQEVAHHYHFLVNSSAGTGTVNFLVPREGRLHQLALSEVGRESIEISGQSVDAMHFRLGEGSDAREIWVDGMGRVLRVDHSALAYSATRSDLP